MAHIIAETIHSNRRRVWGIFKLSDGSKTKFEMKRDESWFQWGNTCNNLSATVGRVEYICNRWAMGEL